MEGKKLVKKRIAFLIPHIFMQDCFIDSQIFAPADLAISLVNGLSRDFDVTVFAPGKVSSIKAKQVNVDLSLLQSVVNNRLSEYLETNPVGFISNTRQILSELVAKCYSKVKNGEFDLVHVYLSEDDQALFFADLIDVPVLFTHHDPYNLYSKYKARFPKLLNLNYISISYSQRQHYPELNYVENIYNAIDFSKYDYSIKKKDYFLYSGRIIEGKGLHTAIKACLELDKKLIIIGKNYSGKHNSKYYEENIKPFIDNKQIVYKGYISDHKVKNDLYKFAKALLFPIERDEPFGMVMIEANASGTPVIAYNNGSVNEVIESGITGIKVKNYKEFKLALHNIEKFNYSNIRESSRKLFDIRNMLEKHVVLYKSMIAKNELLKNKSN